MATGMRFMLQPTPPLLPSAIRPPPLSLFRSRALFFWECRTLTPRPLPRARFRTNVRSLVRHHYRVLARFRFPWDVLWRVLLWHCGRHGAQLTTGKT